MALLILSGCGGSGEGKSPQFHVVAGPGYRFDAPDGWKTSRSDGRTTAADGPQMVQVATFTLVRDYTPSLFAKVEPELALRMSTLAQQTGGTVAAHRTVKADGVRSHAYDVKVGGRTQTYVFVLKGKREYQLLCSADGAVCSRFFSSFSAG